MASATLTVRNVWTEVAADADAYSLLDKKLKVWVKGAERRWEYKRKQWDGYEHNFTPNHKFRSGLVGYVTTLLQQAGYTVSATDERDHPRPGADPTLRLVGIKLRDYQREAVYGAVAEERGVIQVGTGGGKTEIMAGIIKRLDLPTLMLVDQQHLASQTRDRLNERLGRNDVGLYGAGKKQDGPIVCATFQSMNARLKANREKTLDWLSRFDVLIVDECHHLVAATYQAICDKIPAYYRLGFSATPFKSKGVQDRDKNDDPAALLHVTGTFGPLITEVIAGDLADDGYLVPANVEMVNWRSPTIEPTWGWEREDYDLDDDQYEYGPRKATQTRAYRPGLYKLGISENKERNRAVVAEATALSARGLPVLVFVDKVEHGKELYAAFAYGQAQLIHGKHGVDVRNVALKRLSAGDVPIVIASTVLDEGVDIPANIALVFAGGGKAQHRYIQRIGRGQRLAAKKTVVEVRDFYDTNSKTLWIHSKKRLDAYRSDPAGYTVRIR